ncbi:hypothetical protein COLO4_10081 [Corchorus olitorius]|uniref:Uncharacterized protein n=1 Tax=Corchorus olitorius TaxID=93759 RepID=A0A1R3KA16_9ROSI|nr:hypothetical protein COLO4_10081 [Corchorus olitorius]
MKKGKEPSLSGKEETDYRRWRKEKGERRCRGEEKKMRFEGGGAAWYEKKKKEEME